MRSQTAIRRMQQLYSDFSEYDEQSNLLHQIECHGHPVPPEDKFNRMMAYRKRLEAKYGAEALEIDSDFDAGLIAGWLSALEWVLSDSDPKVKHIQVKIQG